MGGCGLSSFVVLVLVDEISHDVLLKFAKFLLDGLLRRSSYALLNFILFLLLLLFRSFVLMFARLILL